MVFNEKGTSSLTITGVTFNIAGLGLTSVDRHGVPDRTPTSTRRSPSSTPRLGTLRTQASKFGSNLTTVQTRQDFTKNLITTLQTGADNLVLADTNEEGANLLALQTRQQLSTTALSLANQAEPGRAAAVRLIHQRRSTDTRRRGHCPAVFLLAPLSTLRFSAQQSLMDH